MKKIKKNHIIITALAIMIAAAGYINYAGDLDNIIKVKDKEKVRVSVIHNNLAMDHFLYSLRNSSLISWDNYKIDTPVLDFITLFHNEYLNIDFSAYLEHYFNAFELNDDEKDLLFILLNIPINLQKNDNIQKNTINVHNNILYLLKAEKLTKEYYSNNSDNE